MRTLIDILGLLSVVMILASTVIYFTVESLLTYAAAGLIGGMVCLLIYVGVSFERLSRFFTRQSTKHGLNLLITAVVLLSIIGIVEVIGARHNVRFDLTPEQDLTLSPLTKKVLRALDQQVNITVFYQRDQIFDFRDLLKRFSDETDYISYQFFPLDQNPAKAQEYGIGSYGAVAVESEGKRRKFNYCTEENIVNGIVSVTSDEDQVIYFVKGHGERDFKSLDKREGYSTVRSALESEGYEVRDLLLLREEKVPDDASVLIVSGPQEEFLPGELRMIRDYIESGGRVLFMIDPYTAPKLAEFLTDYNIQLGDDMVVDKESKLFAGDIFSPLVPYYRKHPITENFDVATVFPLVRSVEIVVPRKSQNTIAKSLCRTSPESWGEVNRESIKKGEVYFQEWEDKKGPVSIAAVAEIYGNAQEYPEGEGSDEYVSKDVKDKVPQGRIVVCGDSDFASNLYINVLGNKDFFLNIVNWLAEKEELISLRHKKDETSPFSPLFLTENQQRVIFWCAVIIQPLLILCVGIVVYVRRRIRG